ncbi:hypothetical protein HYX08_06860 [Candidatus Woesearchaeota archaeon]|nr:hypothetical protein [Candidatus Woesearchaeota archaeon]
MWREEVKIKSEQEKISYKYFVSGTLVGIAGGIFGNILVNSMYRFIDQNPRGHNLITLIVGFIGFILVILVAYMKLRKN